MNKLIIYSHLMSEEKETHINYNYLDKKWFLDTTIMKHYNKAKKQGWKQIKEYVYEDNTVCGGCFEAPERAITIRNYDKKQLSDKQLGNLSGTDE